MKRLYPSLQINPKKIFAQAMAVALLIPASQLPAADLRGWVRDTGTGEGIDGATISLDVLPADGTPDATATSDPFGFYELSDVGLSGAFLLNASRPGYIDSSSTETPLSVDEDRGVDIDLTRSDPTRELFDFTVEVRDLKSDILLSGVPIKILRFTTSDGTDTPESRLAHTDADGGVTFRGLQPGYFRFEINQAADMPRPKWDCYTTEGLSADLKRIEGHRAISVDLQHDRQDLTFRVFGFNPVSEANENLEGFHVELTGLNPADESEVVVPKRIGKSSGNGELEFKNLPAIPWRVQTKRIGYEPVDMIIRPHAATGDLPALPVLLTPEFVQRGLFIFMTSPYLIEDNPATPEFESAHFLFREIPVVLEGIPGTPTEGISRTETIQGDPQTSFQDGRTFSNLLPGTYRLSVSGQSPPAVVNGFVKPLFQGVKHVTLDDLFPHEGQLLSIEELPVDVLPATIRGRLLAADSSSEPIFAGGRVRRPLYLPKAQAGIEIVEHFSPGGNFDQLLPPGSRIISVDTDPDGHFTAQVLPGLYGFRIPTMSGYTGSVVSVADVTSGSQSYRIQGWPYPEEWPNGFTGLPPENGTGSAGFPLLLESCHEYCLDLYVRKTVADVTGTVLADIGDPTRQIMFSEELGSDDVVLRYSDLGTPDSSGVVGSATLGPLPGGENVEKQLRPERPVLSGFQSSNAVFRFPEVPPGSYTIEFAHPRNTFSPATNGVIVPSWPSPGILPIADPLPLGNPQPLTTTFSPADAQAEYVDSGSSATWQISNWDGSEYDAPIEQLGFRHDFAEVEYGHGNYFVPGKSPAGAFDFYREFAAGQFIKGSIGSAGDSLQIPVNVGGPEATQTNPGPSSSYSLMLEAVAYNDVTYHVPGASADINGTIVPIVPPGVVPSPPTDGLDIAGSGASDSWVSRDTFLRLVDPVARQVKFTLYLEKEMSVSASVEEEGGGPPVPGACVRLLDRFGGAILGGGLVPAGTPGDYALPIPLGDTEVVFLEVCAAGYEPYRVRLSPDMASSDAVAHIHHDVVLKKLPLPAITGTSLDRFGAFLPAITRGGDQDAFDPLATGGPLTCTWSATALGIASYSYDRPKFDTPAGDSGGSETVAIPDQISELWIVDPRAYAGSPHASPPLSHVPPAADLASPVLVHEWLRMLEKGNLGHVFYRRLRNASPASPLTRSSAFQISELPPGKFEPVFVAVTERGAVSVFTGFTYPTPGHVLDGRNHAGWFGLLESMLSDIASAELDPTQLLDFVPEGMFVPDALFEADIDLDPANPGFVDYAYELGTELTSGFKSGAAGVLSLLPGVIGVPARADARFGSRGVETQMFLDFESAGSADQPAEIVSKMTPSAFSGVPAPSITGSVRAGISSTSMAVPGEEGELEIEATVDGGYSVEMSAPLSREKLVRRLPHAGKMLSRMAGEGSGHFSYHLSASSKPTAVHRWQTPDPDHSDAESGTEEQVADIHANRRHIFGGQSTSADYGGTFPADAMITIGRGSAVATVGLAGENGGFTPTVEPNPFGDWPQLKWVDGELRVELRAERRRPGFHIRMRVKNFRAPFSFGRRTGTRFSVSRVKVENEIVSLVDSSLPATVVDGGSVQTLRDLQPLAVVAQASGTRDGLLFAEFDAAAGQMQVKVAAASAGAAFGAPVEIASADAVIAADLIELAGGRSMAVWTQVESSDLGRLHAPSEVWYSISDPSGANWSVPALVQSRSDVAEDLRLVVNQNHVGLLIRSNENGPDSQRSSIDGSDWNGTTWSAVVPLLAESTMLDFDATGSGLTSTNPARLATINKDGHLDLFGWSGGAALTPADRLLTGTAGGQLDLFPGAGGDIYCLAEDSGGAIAGFANGGAAWSPLGLALAPGGADSLQGAFLPDPTTPSIIVAWTGSGLGSPIYYAFVDAATGATVAGPVNLTRNTRGEYSNLRAIPRPGRAARIAARFDINPTELRQFDVSLAEGSGGNDSDGDGVDDLGELLIVDADSSDAIETVGDALPGDDFDGDGFDNGTEIAAGTDPTDPGSFPEPAGVIVQATEPHALESGLEPAVFTVTRPAGDHSAPLTVQFALSGSAVAGIDYIALGTSVTIAAGEPTAQILVMPLEDGLTDGDKNLTLAIAADPSYTVGAPESANIQILDLPFNRWRIENFPGDLDNSAISGPGADPENDGIINLIEFALLLDPLSRDDQALPPLKLIPDSISGEEHLTLSYTENLAATDLAYAAQVSADLELWQGGGALVEEVSRINNGDGTQTVTVRVVSDAATHAKHFMRLLVTHQ